MNILKYLICYNKVFFANIFKYDKLLKIPETTRSDSFLRTNQKRAETQLNHFVYFGFGLKFQYRYVYERIYTHKTTICARVYSYKDVN